MKRVRMLTGWLGLGMLAFCAPADGQPLTEGEAVRIGLEVAAWREWADTSMDEARRKTSATGLLENPEFEFADESLDLPGGNTDRFYWLRQPLDLTGRNSLARESARASEGVRAADIDMTRRQRATAIRAAFYRVIRLRSESGAMETWRARLAELSQAVTERVRVGDASRFDHLRIERETALLDGRLAATRAELNSTRDRLFGILDTSPRSLAGHLLPPEPPARETVMTALRAHPELGALQAGAEADRLAARSAAREVWPEVTLGLGFRELEDGPLSENGAVFSLGVEVPLFDRGRQRRAAAEAGAGAKSAEAALAVARLEADARALLDELAMRRSAALKMRMALEGETNSLPEIAEAAYSAGELDVMNLLDAWQTELDLQLQAIELEYAARVAAIELMQLTGESQ